METILQADNLFIIVTDWVDNPFEEKVITSLKVAEDLAKEYNKDKYENSFGYAKVMSLTDFYAHQYDKGSEAASYN